MSAPFTTQSIANLSSIALVPSCSLSYIDVLPRHPSIRSTLPLTKPPMPSNPTGSSQLAGPGARVHGDGLADDEAIGDEFADGLAGVGVGDLVHFVRV